MILPLGTEKKIQNAHPTFSFDWRIFILLAKSISIAISVGSCYAHELYVQPDAPVGQRLRQRAPDAGRVEELLMVAPSGARAISMSLLFSLAVVLELLQSVLLRTLCRELSKRIPEAYADRRLKLACDGHRA